MSGFDGMVDLFIEFIGIVSQIYLIWLVNVTLGGQILGTVDPCCVDCN